MDEPVCEHCGELAEINNKLITDGDHYYHVKCEMKYFEYDGEANGGN